MKTLFRSLLIGLITAGIFSAGLYAFAIPPTSTYTPGETLNPNCSPGQPNCTVTPPVPYTGATQAVNLGANNFTTTGTGAFGALTAITIGATTINATTINAANINGLNITSSTGTLDIANGKTLTVTDSATIATNSLTFAGGEVVTFTPTHSLTFGVTGATNITFPTTGTLYGTATDSITSAQLATSLTNETGTGVAVFSTSPTLVTPVLGAATYTTLSGGNITDSALTAGRVTFAGTAGILVDDSDLTFSGDTLSATKLLSSTSVSTPSLISTGSITMTPGAGTNFNLNLSTTGDFAVNTNQLYVDTSTGFVGIGDASPVALLTVGSGDLFQVSSSGAIAAATGITSSGSITFSGFSTNGGIIYTNGSGLLLQTGAGTSTTVLHGGANPAYSAVSLTADVTGVLPVANGGTNSSSPSITAFNNITGYAAAGATGTTSTNLVFSTSPTLVTPVLGVATATSINGLTISSSTGTLAITNGKTLTVSDSTTLATNSLTFAGGEVVTFTPTHSLTFGVTGATSITLPTSGTLYGTATDSITSAQLATSLTNETGTGTVVFSTSPTLVTPVLGAATYTTLSGGNITDSALTAGRVTFAGTAGILVDDTDLTFSGDTLSATKLLSSTSVSTPSLISTGSITMTPGAGTNFNLNLSTTGDFAVNTNQLYVDTSTGFVGLGTATPGYKFEVDADTDGLVTAFATTENGATLFYGQAGSNGKFRAQKNGLVGALGLYLTDGSNVNTGTTTVSLNGTGASYFNAGNLGIGTTSPAYLLDVNGTARIGQKRVISTTRTVPTVLNSTVAIGVFDTTHAHSLRMTIAVNDSNFSVVKSYILTSNYDQTAGAWKIVPALSDSGSYSSNDFQLEANQLASELTLRVRRIGAGTTAGTARITMDYESDATGIFTASTTTASGVATVSAFYPTTNITQTGGYVGIGLVSPAAALDVNGTVVTAYGSGYEGRVNGGSYSAGTGGFYPFASVIGANDTVVKYAGGSNSFVLQHGSTNVLVANASENVGIGTASPTQKLEVYGNIQLSNATITSGVLALKPTGFGYAQNSYRVLQVGNSTGNETVSIGYDPSVNADGGFAGDGREVVFRNGVQFITPNTANTAWYNPVLTMKDGSVGIGTASPGEKLEVYNGNLKINSAVGTGTASPATGFLKFDNQYDTTGNSTANKIVLYDDGSTFKAGLGVSDNTVNLFSGGNFRFWTDHVSEASPGTNVFTIADSTGYVGIGVTAPGRALEVNGAIAISGTASDGYDAATNGIRFQSGYSHIFQDTSLGLRMLVYNSGSPTGITLTQAGNVGIGTTTPNASFKLDVQGFARAHDSSQRGIELQGGTTGYVLSYDRTNAVYLPMQILGSTIALNPSGNTGLMVDASLNVGIGTTTPAGSINAGAYFKPDASGKILGLYSESNESVVNLISNQNSDGAHIGGLYFTRAAGQTDAHNQIAAIEGRQKGTGTTAGGELWFFTKPNGSGATVDEARMMISNTGLVGIGTTSPGTTLDVTGTGRFSSTLTASSGLTLTTGALNLTSSSGAVALTLSSSTTAFNVNSGVFDIDTTNSRVGIGTTTPGAKLDVTVSASSLTNNIKFGDAAYGYLASGSSGVYISNTSGTALMTLQHTGNVGIGTSSPYSTLSVNGNINFQGGSGGQLLAYTGSAYTAMTMDAASYSIATSGTARMAILAGGNVGIGTAAPVFNAGTGLQVHSSGNAQGSIRLTNSTTGALINRGMELANVGTLGYLWQFENDALIFGTNNTEKARITAAGNLGIGTTTPTGLLSVMDGTNTSTYQMRVGYTDGTYDFGIGREPTTGALFVQGTQVGFNNIILAPTSGSVGIGTSTPARLLEVSKSQAASTFVKVTNANTSTTDYSTQAGYELSVAGSTIGSLKTTARNLIGLSAKSLYLTTAGAFPIAFGTDDSATPSMVILNTTGYVGIGTASPGSRLDVVSSDNTNFNSAKFIANNLSQSTSVGWAGISGTYSLNYDAVGDGTTAQQWLVGGVAKMTLLSSGNVGIGTTAPATQFSNSATQQNDGATGVGSLNWTFGSEGYVAGLVNTSSNNSADGLMVKIGNTNGNSSILNLLSGSNVSRLYVRSDGNIGIGTTSPTFLLQVNGAANFGDGPFSTGAGTLSTSYYDQADGVYYHTPGGMVRKDSSATDMAQAAATFVLYNENGTNNTGTKLVFANNESTAGGANPIATAAIVSQKVSGTAGGWGSGNLKFLVKSGSAYTDVATMLASGNVGIGTTSPGARLEIKGSSTGNVLLGELGGSATYGAIGLANSLTAGNYNFASGAADPNLYINRPTGYAISFRENNGTGQMTIAGNGNIGIGTTAPGRLLDIVGPTTGQRTGNLLVDGMLLGENQGGAYFGRVGLAESQLGLTNYGNTWSARDSNRSWTNISMSSNGKYQTASAWSDYLYNSSDYGATWTAVDSSRNWDSIAMSADGKVQTAVANAGLIYTSVDWGQNWTSRDSSRAWQDVDVSSDGKYQTAADLGGQLHISSDFGVTWTAAGASSTNWIGIGLSSDGKYQTATVYGGQIYTSTDYGATWTARDSSRNWVGVAVSSDGRYQVASVGNGHLYTSTDYGATWSSRGSVSNWQWVTISSSGQIQAAASSSGNVDVSTDYGATWTTKATSGGWGGVAMSSDGKIMAATAGSDKIYESFADSLINGNLGIGVTPTYALDVLASGTGVIARFNSANSTGCTLATGGTISCSSDETLKKNIEDIDYGLTQLMGLRPVQFNWKTEKDEDNPIKSLGFIAQEVEKIIPKLVTTDSTTNLKQLNTIGLVPVLTKSLQQQQKLLGEFTMDKEGTLVATVQAEDRQDAVAAVSGMLTKDKQILTNFVAARVTAIRGYFDEVFAKKVHSEEIYTKEICVGEEGNVTCVTKDKLDQLINGNGGGNNAAPPAPAPAPEPEPEPETPATDDPVIDEPVVEEPAPEETPPAPEPEPAPESAPEPTP